VERVFVWPWVNFCCQCRIKPFLPCFVSLMQNQALFNLLCFMKVFSFYFKRKTFSGNCEKFRNIILFADYIKFDPQTFDCYIYIYFVLNIFFQFYPLKFNFYINFGYYFYNCYLIFPYYFLIEIFYLSNLVLILLIVTYFI